MEDDRTYFARRAEEQRRAALRASSKVSRLRHLELATLLADRGLLPMPMPADGRP